MTTYRLTSAGALFAAIGGLFIPCRPATIGRLISVVVVGIAINGMVLGGSWAHVSKEVFESAPALANRNASGPVVLEGLVFGIYAPLKDGAPSPVFWGSGHAVARSAFDLLASTGLSVSRSHAARSRHHAPSAFATEQPEPLPRRVMLDELFCGQPSVSFANLHHSVLASWLHHSFEFSSALTIAQVGLK